MSGVLRSATVAERERRPARASGPCDGTPTSTSAVGRLDAAGDGERAEPGGRAAQQLLEARVLVGELQRLDEIALRATRS